MPDTKEIHLSRGKNAIVDASDHKALNVYRWYCDTNGYAARNLPRGNSPRVILMHREIMNFPSGFVIDHIDGDRLNNQRSNLRICSIGQNVSNQRRHRNNTSGVKGVSLRQTKSGLRYDAKIMVNRKFYHLGSFLTLEEASNAYAKGAQFYHGEFHRLT